MRADNAMRFRNGWHSRRWTVGFSAAPRASRVRDGAAHGAFTGEGGVAPLTPCRDFSDWRRRDHEPRPGRPSVEVSPSAGKIAPRRSCAGCSGMILPERVFGRPGANWMWSGEAIGPISLRDPGTRPCAAPRAADRARHQRDIGVDALPLDVVRVADDRQFRHRLVRRRARSRPRPCQCGHRRR